jgi:hypothetical protein
MNIAVAGFMSRTLVNRGRDDARAGGASLSASTANFLLENAVGVILQHSRATGCFATPRLGRVQVAVVPHQLTV